MKTSPFLLILLAILCLIPAAAQSVVITPKKMIYRRPRPIHEGKTTFSVRRPIAKASTPSLSRKITVAISPETALGLNINEELADLQWLYEADYAVLFNRHNILSVRLRMSGAGAYPDDLTKYVVVDVRTGNRLKPSDIFTNLAGLAAMAKKTQRNEIRSTLAEMKKDPENAEVDAAQLFEETDFKIADLAQFSVGARGVTFYYDYGFPHAIEALQPAGRYTFSWTQLKPFIRRDGLLSRFVS